jgi:hypothetical protein
MTAFGSAAQRISQTGSLSVWGPERVAPCRTSQTQFRVVASSCKYKGSGQAVIRLGSRDVYLEKYGSAASREDYKRAIAAWSQRGGSDSPPPLSITVSQVLVAYLKLALCYYVKVGEPVNDVRMVRCATALQCTRQFQRTTRNICSRAIFRLRIKYPKSFSRRGDHRLNQFSNSNRNAVNVGS